ASADANPLRTGQGRVLVMDDEPDILNFSHVALKKLGYQAELARDGTEAIRRYRDAREAGHPFSAVIMDLTIPGGMGGKEAINQPLSRPAATLSLLCGERAGRDSPELCARFAPLNLPASGARDVPARSGSESNRRLGEGSGTSRLSEPLRPGTGRAPKEGSWAGNAQSPRWAKSMDGGRFAGRSFTLSLGERAGVGRASDSTESVAT